LIEHVVTRESFQQLIGRMLRCAFSMAAWRERISGDARKQSASEDEVSDQSRRGLDWVNFFVADVQTGFGAFLAFYLASIGWTKDTVGVALMIGGLAGVATQIPAGALTDHLHWKRALAASGIGTLVLSALLIAFLPNIVFVGVAEVLHGLASSLIAPAIAAISLGLVGRQGMSARTGRNYGFAAAGNSLTAVAMGLLAAWLSAQAIFIGVAALCIPALIALAAIRPNEISYIRARNAKQKKKDGFDLKRLRDLAKSRNLLLFAACLMLFQFSNASMLPLISQNLGQNKDSMSPIWMGLMVAGPQIVVTFLAPWIGYWSEAFGRKPLLFAAFAIESIRAILFAIISAPPFLIAAQMFDGITGAIILVLTVIVITDLTAGTGRFNLAQGVVGTATGIAGALSTGTTGFVVQRFGDLVGFLSLGCVAISGLIMLTLLLPETKPKKY
jgi:MFS family permease